MSEQTETTQEVKTHKPWWWRLQAGQALVEYWPTLPAAIMVSIVAGALVGPLGDIFQQTADGLTDVACETSVGDTGTDLDGGHRIEVTSSVYDPDTDRTTVSFKVSSGGSPSISHWVLGIDQATADKIVASSEAHESWGTDPTTGKTGIKFDTGYEGTGGGGGGGKGGGKGASLTRVSYFKPVYRPLYNVYVEERDIVLTMTGYVDFIETVEVTTKAGSSQVSTGYVAIPTSGGSSGEDC